ncbi:hypothetical protein PR048_029199 [Dryococelus australis]|uniref:Coiled-coil domain-containing protein 51 n=1 Tax=Dryococelus australis TaxID=614101 RepID=A0ABQ9GCP0_9NEOP|nr:hypothetical protein PR048_029199 [Dryococelus australis]
MDEVRLAQNRVLEAESKFIKAQEKRREANRQVAAVQNQLKELYAELDKTSRGEERYLHLITQEHKILKEERQYASDFQQSEREERDCFASLSSAVKESHEKERAQAERTKYWSIIGSIIGTVIGVVGSTINNNLKMKELRKMISAVAVQSNENNIPSFVSELGSQPNKELLKIVTEMKNVAHTQQEDSHTRLAELADLLDDTLAAFNREKMNGGQISSVLQNHSDSMEKNFQELKQAIQSLCSGNQLDKDQVFVVPPSYDETYLELQKQTKLLFVGTAAIGGIAILVPVILRYMGPG